jgi:hypothetical protein
MADATSERLYAPIYDVIPDNWPEAKNHIVEQMTAHADSINAKEIGWYYDIEVDSGKKFIPATNSSTSEQYRTIFRKVIDTGALPNAGSTTTAHGLTIGSAFCLIQMYGAGTDPSTAAIPLPFSSPTLNENIKLELNTTNVVITTAIDYSGYTKSYVVIEYIQEG